MKSKVLPFVLILTITLTSCASKIIETALKKAGVTDKQVTLTKIEHSEKDLLFLEMVHLGQKEFYDDVKHKVDSLTSLDYHVFYEGLYLRRSDRIIKEKDTISYLKVRKLLGLDPLIDYSKTKPFSVFVDDYNLVDQPDYIDLGITKFNSEPVDISLVEQIELYENLNGEIQLDECDFDTKLVDENYNCEKLSKKERKLYMDEIVFKKRNQKVYENIQSSDKDKILIIYGKKHLNGISKLIEKKEIQ